MNNQTEQLRLKIARQIVLILTSGLRNKTITLERAKEIAKMVLKTLPKGLSKDKLHAVIPQLDDRYPELSPVVKDYLTHYEELTQQTYRGRITQLVKQQKFDEATQLMKKIMEAKK